MSKTRGHSFRVRGGNFEEIYGTSFYTERGGCLELTARAIGGKRYNSNVWRNLSRQRRLVWFGLMFDRHCETKGVLLFNTLCKVEIAKSLVIGDKHKYRVEIKAGQFIEWQSKHEGLNSQYMLLFYMFIRGNCAWKCWAGKSALTLLNGRAGLWQPVAYFACISYLYSYFYESCWILPLLHTFNILKEHSLFSQLKVNMLNVLWFFLTGTFCDRLWGQPSPELY